MAGKKTKGGGKGIPANPAKSKAPTSMLIRNDIPAELFLKAMKNSHAKSQGR